MKAPSGNIILYDCLIIMHNLTETAQDRRSGTYQEAEHRPCFKIEDNIHPSSKGQDNYITFWTRSGQDMIWYKSFER